MFTDLFNKYLLKTYDIPSTLLSAKSEKSRLQNSLYNLTHFYFLNYIYCMYEFKS